MVGIIRPGISVDCGLQTDFAQVLLSRNQAPALRNVANAGWLRVSVASQLGQQLIVVVQDGLLTFFVQSGFDRRLVDLSQGSLFVLVIQIFQVDDLRFVFNFLLILFGNVCNVDN